MIIPIRNIAKNGIITDVDAYDLGLESLSVGINIRCELGHIERGPIAKSSGTLPHNPRHAFSFEDASGATQVHVVAADGTVCDYTAKRTTDLSPAGVYPADSGAVVTTTISNGTVYINREDRVPLYRSKTSTGGYVALDGYTSGNGGAQFPHTTRFKSLRSTAGFLVGINVTDNGINVPTKVKWSTLATSYGFPPDDWDVNGILPNGKASQGGENILAEMTGSLVDGLSLANNLVLYGSKETWLMSFVGGVDIFDFRRLFDSGVINTNCVVEYQGLHYVFGNDDIYVHDGTGQKRSIADNRVRKFINKSIVKSETRKCFAVHNRQLNEIMFCYVSADQYCAFPYTSSSVDGCNRAAVYNISADCWYFYDLPWVSSATSGPSSPDGGWDEDTSSWDEATGAWSSDDIKNTFLIASPAFSGVVAAMRSYTSPDDASSTGSIDAVAAAPVLILKEKMDMDEVKGSNPYASTEGSKQISGLIIECSIDPSSKPIDVTVGSSSHPSTSTTWGISQTFDIDNARIDCNEQGRFLAIRMTYDDVKAFRMSGYDLEMQIVSKR